MKIQGSGQGALLLDSSYAAIDEILAGIGRWRSYGATITGTAAVGNKAIAEINNANGNPRTAFFYLGDLWVATAMSVTIVPDGTSLAPAGLPTNMISIGTASALRVGGGNQLAPTGAAFHATPSLTANLQYSLPGWFWYALPPNHNLQFQGGTVNQAFTVNVRWIELTI